MPIMKYNNSYKWQMPKRKMKKDWGQGREGEGEEVEETVGGMKVINKILLRIKYLNRGWEITPYLDIQNFHLMSSH